MTVAHPTTPQDLKSIARLTLSIDFDPLLVSDSVRFCVPFFSQVPKLAPPKKILILLPAGPSAGAAGLLFFNADASLPPAGRLRRGHPSPHARRGGFAFSIGACVARASPHLRTSNGTT